MAKGAWTLGEYPLDMVRISCAKPAVYRLRLFFVMTFLQMVSQFTTRFGLAGQGHFPGFPIVRHQLPDSYR